MTRRELLAMAATAPLLNAAAKEAPTAPVVLAKCPSYDGDLVAALTPMFDQAGIPALVKNKTVTIKLNLTGSPGLKFQGRALGTTHYTHPKTVMAVTYLLNKAGAQRIRLVESCWGTGGPLEEYMLDSGWNVRALKSNAPNLVFENTNALGTYKKYARFKVPGQVYMYPAYDLNSAYEETDVFMSMAKLKNHATCGVTLSMKNCFGNTPASIYGDDRHDDRPNESPTKGRVEVCHMGKLQPAGGSLAEKDPTSPRDPGYRMPRIVAELNATRPVNIAFIDGIETMVGGEGPWVNDRPTSYAKPGVLLLGTNAVTTDSVATAVMGYDPRAPKGVAPFKDCDNSLMLAEALGVGTTDLKRIEVRGAKIEDCVFRFNDAPAKRG